MRWILLSLILLSCSHHERRVASTDDCPNLMRGFFTNEKVDLDHPIFTLETASPEVLSQKLEQSTTGKDLIELWSGYRHKKDDINRSTLKSFEHKDSVTVKNNRVSALTPQQIQQVYDEVANNDVASLCRVTTYDPDGNMGFCFGRALTAHLELLAAGVDKRSIKKLWVMGQLKTKETMWRYHVTTVVKASDGKWWTIDPILGQPAPVSTWYMMMQQFDSTKNAIFLPTSAKRLGVGPDSDYSWKYAPKLKKEISNPVYLGYFEDLMKTYRERRKSPHFLDFRP